MNTEITDTLEWQKRELNALKASQQSSPDTLGLVKFRDQKNYKNSSSTQTVIMLKKSWVKFKSSSVSPIAILGCNIVSTASTSYYPRIREIATDETNTVMWDVLYGFDCTLLFEIVSTVEGEVTYGDY